MKEESQSSKDILINVESKETRMAIMVHQQLVDFVIERRSFRPITGNIYKGKVTNILANIQSAFIDLGERENGFIHISDIVQNTQKFQEMFDMDFKATDKHGKESSSDITSHLRDGQNVLVQVVKEPIGAKGARLTSNISIPGRYLVLLPNTPHRGVSRKIEDVAARNKLKKLIRSFDLPQEMGLICRTASVQALDEQAFIDEAHQLVEIWEDIRNKFNAPTPPPYLLYEESDLVKRALMMAIDKGFDRIIFDDPNMHKKCLDLYKKTGGESENVPNPIKIELFRDRSSSGSTLFERFGVERQLEKAMRHKVWMDNGGYLFFDHTEAMHTVDVNSGRSNMRASKDGERSNSDDLEQSIVNINISAAEEIARQVRIRNLGGLIICDFIDMQSRKSQKRVLDALKNAMQGDSAKFTILGMSEFGLVEMTRQRNRESLHQTLFGPCPYCTGSGNVKKDESTLIDIERSIKKLLAARKSETIELVTNPQLEIKRGDRNHLTQMVKNSGNDLLFATSDILHLNDYQFFSKEKKELIHV